MKNNLICSLAGICLLATSSLLHAQLNFTATIGGIPSVNGATLETFNAGVPANLTLSGLAAIETGPTFGSIGTGIYASPYYSGSTAAYFGESPTSGNTTGKYIAVADSGSATFTFSTPEEYFGLLWGSIDPTNLLSFYNSGNQLIGTLTGAQVIASNPSIAQSDTGPDGTVYVNITSTTPFSSVVVTDPNSAAFELDDVAYAQVVPEPASGALAAVGLGALGFIWRKKRA